MTEESRNWYDKGKIGQLKSRKRRASKELKLATDSLASSALRFTESVKEVEYYENQIYVLEAQAKEQGIDIKSIPPD